MRKFFYLNLIPALESWNNLPYILPSPLFFGDTVPLPRPGWPQTPTEIHLPQPSECWDQRHAPPRLDPFHFLSKESQTKKWIAKSSHLINNQNRMGPNRRGMLASLSPSPVLPSPLVLLALLSPFFSLAPHLWGVVWVLYGCGSDPQHQACQGNIPPSFIPHSMTLFSCISISHLHTWCESFTPMSCKEICNVWQWKWLQSWKHYVTISCILSWLYAHGWLDKYSLRSSLKIQSF